MTRESRIHKNEIFWFLVTAILITIAFRWPMTYHETGVDSYNIHNLANSAAQFGEMKWILNPLSLFGLYPFSYASGMPIMLAEFSNMSGLEMEACFLVFSLMVAIIAAITTFLLGMELRNSATFAFAISLLYSASPLLLFWTQWTITTRNLFMALLPLSLWILLRMSRVEKRESNVLTKKGLNVLLFLNILLLAFIHNLFLMIALFIFAYLISKRIYRIIERPNRVIGFGGKRVSAYKIVTLTIIIAVIGLVAVISYMVGWLGLESYQSGFFDGSSEIGRFLNLLSSISATIGFPMAFLFPISFIVFLKNRRGGFISLFFLISFLFILPFSGGRTYERLLYPLVLGVMILLASYMFVLRKNQRLYIKVLVISLLLTLPINLALVDHYNRWSETNSAVNDGPATPDHVYMTSMYCIHYSRGDRFTGNNWLTSEEIQAYSHMPHMLWDDTVILIYGVIEPDEVNAYVNTLDEFLSSGGEIFSTDWKETLYLDYAYMFLYRENPVDARDIIDKYDIKYFIEDSRLNERIMGYDPSVLYPSSTAPAPFIVGVHQTTYKIYDNGVDIVWIV